MAWDVPKSLIKAILGLQTYYHEKGGQLAGNENKLKVLKAGISFSWEGRRV